ncbi:putative transcription factor B3-Domain family [Helianthus anomalus]
MTLKREKSNGKPRYAVKEWTSFLKSNGIEDGDRCTFTYIKSVDMLILHEVAKSKNHMIVKVVGLFLLFSVSIFTTVL